MNKMLVKRDAYTPTGWLVNSTHLTVQLYSEFARTTVKMNVTASDDSVLPPLILYGQDLKIEAIFINDTPQVIEDIQKQGESISLLLPNSSNDIEVVTICNPYENKALEGLYKSGDMICTQCEPEGFRRIFYYPDRPDMMSVFTTRIEADARIKNLLSNGNLISSGKLEGDRHFAEWHDPFPKPSYLFALVAGDLELVEDSFTTASGRVVDLHIYVEHGNSHLTSHAMESLKKSMRWDEKSYGLEYDLDLFQIVAVSHFNMGAMENKGLNIFNSKFVLADEKTASDTDLMRVESIIAHEYFHNWTGNRVTCRDWFQLTLKEGLTVYRDQCFTADLHDSSVKRIEDVSLLRSVQFPEDASPMAHPIRPDSYSEINNFYTPTIYEKGSEVIRMLASLFGRDGFRKGIDLYFDRHDGNAVTCDDFLSAMEDANKYDLSEFSRWYQQSGTPHIYVNREKKGSDLEISLVQKKPENASSNDKMLPIPFRFSMIGKSGDPLSLVVNGQQMGVAPMVVLNSEKTRLKIQLSDQTKSQNLYDATPSLLRGFSAPVKLHDDLSIEEYLHLISFDTDPFVIWDAAQILYNKVISEAYLDRQNASLEMQLSEALRASLKSEKFNDAFKALLLMPPSQSILLAEVEHPDPPNVFFAKQNVVRRIAGNISGYLRIQLENAAADLGVLDASGRSLHNQILAWGVLADIELAQSLALKQVSNPNMTLVKGAISALNNID
ncbi:MAG: aminopeptidase N, partial [Alphaproteobacteria bacterium]|nr:aminopeptidase N [Alphaproteobacteria bacterium]